MNAICTALYCHITHSMSWVQRNIELPPHKQLVWIVQLAAVR